MDFLRIRISEDEERAQEPYLALLADVRRFARRSAGDEAEDAKVLARTLYLLEVSRGSYDRGRREREARRRIVGLHKPDDHCPRGKGAQGADICPTLSAIASIYQDHPDFDLSWRP